jgi:urease accessory protein
VAIAVASAPPRPAPPLEPPTPAGSAELHVALDDSRRSVITRLAASGLVGIRPTAWGAWLVGAGAHPIGGDVVVIGVDVGTGATLRVGSVAATVARPGKDGLESTTTVEARVGAGATLLWAPEPGVAAARARHRADARVALAPTARLAWMEQVVLGRAGESPGTWRSAVRVDRGERTELVGELGLGPEALGWSSPSVLGGCAAALTLVVVDPGCRVPPEAAEVVDGGDARGVLVPTVSGATVQITAWGDHVASCRDVARSLFERLGPSVWLPDLWSG